jgi:hypothetical protein
VSGPAISHGLQPLHVCACGCSQLQRWRGLQAQHRLVLLGCMQRWHHGWQHNLALEQMEAVQGVLGFEHDKSRMRVRWAVTGIRFMAALPPRCVQWVAHHSHALLLWMLC